MKPIARALSSSLIPVLKLSEKEKSEEHSFLKTFWILSHFVTLLMTRTKVGEKLEDRERKVVESDPSGRVT